MKKNENHVRHLCVSVFNERIASLKRYVNLVRF